MAKSHKFSIPRQPIPKIEMEKRLETFEEVFLPYDTERALIEADRCINCKQPKCEEACPLHNHIEGWISFIQQGKFMEAAALSRETSSMPEICGRLCPQERLCEGACVVGIKYEPVAIGALERFVNDYAEAHGGLPDPPKAHPTGKKVAIVGSGPAGMACADQLLQKGHEVTLFESWPKPSGILIYGIPNFKMDKSVAEKQIERLERMGAKFICNTTIGKDLTLEDLSREFDAIFLGIGAGVGKGLNVEGEEFEGVYKATPFLVRQNLEEEYLPEDLGGKIELKRKKVVVLGGGDTAMDCVRTAIRMSPESVICVYRRDEMNMPGSRKEVDAAKDEGVQFLFFTAPVKLLGDQTGHLKGIECIRMELGDPDPSGRRRPLPVPDSNFVVEADIAVLALGYDADPVIPEQAKDLKTDRWGLIVIDRETGETSIPGVFAGGDDVNGADLIVTAVRDGRKAADGINLYLKDGQLRKN
ncbi:MAG: NADPH-dependent glutamate synthase [Candidatus Tectomicrobia bacterium]|nr:NADPH-dependent glutamate synthase [Candidatus Tectomicrobia bacterium]